MKGFISRLLVMLGICLTFQVCAQRINPTTQIKKAPGNVPGYILKSNSNGELAFVLDQTVQTGSVNPSAPPPAGASGIYLNSTTNQIFTWSGSAWILYTGPTNLSYTAAANSGTVVSDNGNDALIPAATTSNGGLMSATDKTNLNAFANLTGVAAGSTNMGTFTGGVLPNNTDIKTLFQSIGTNLAAGGASTNGLSGVGLSLDKYRLGGVLNQNTVISGNQGTQSFILDSLLLGRFTASKSSGTGVVSNLFIRTGTAASGILLNTWNMTNSTRLSGLNLDDDALYGLFYDEDGINGGDYGFMITPDAAGTNTKINILTRNIKTGSALNGQVLTLTDAATGEVEFSTVSGGGGGSISTYSAGSGAVVTATGIGVSFTRTTASVWTFNIPSGVELLSFDINSSASQSATTALDIDFVFAGSRPYNQDASADMTDAKIPVVTTLKKINPSTYPTTAAGNNAAWTADVTTTGTLRISTTEFGEVSSSGANATSVKGVF